MSRNNQVTLIGNIVGGDAHYFQKATSRKKAFLKTRVAINDFYYSSDGDRVDVDTVFIDVKAFAQLAENIDASVGKGTYVTVNGRLDAYQQNVIFLSEDNRDEVKAAREDKEKITAEDLEIDGDDRLGLVTIFSVAADSLSVNLNGATVEVEKNEREERGGGSSTSSRRARRSKAADEDEADEKPKSTRSTRRTRAAKKDEDEGAEDAESADDSADDADESAEEEEKPKARTRTTRARRTRASKSDAPESDENF